MKSSTRKLAIGTIFAAIAGYLAGLLTAPKSGKDTRKDIKKTADSAVAKAEKELKTLHTELDDLLEEVKAKGSELTGKAKDQWDELVGNSKLAKQKAREMLSALHEGDADDKDLKEAVTEASNAVKHLKAYLKK